jgi:hypothetical protein
MATKRKQFAKWSRDAAAPTVTYANGKQAEYDPTTLPLPMRQSLLWYGLKQKLADSGSDADTVQEFHDAVEATWTALQNGEFNRQGGGSGKASVETVAEAIARIKGKDYKIVLETLQKRQSEMVEFEGKPSKTFIDVMRENPKVKAEIAAIYAERLQAKADQSDDALDDI